MKFPRKNFYTVKDKRHYYKMPHLRVTHVHLATKEDHNTYPAFTCTIITLQTDIMKLPHRNGVYTHGWN